jgi:hypothetical protein
MWNEFFLGGHDWAIIFPLSENMAQENEERDKVYEDIFGEDYLETEEPFTDIDDGNNDTDFDDGY